jgi:hypothetical protein
MRFCKFFAFIRMFVMRYGARNRKAAKLPPATELDFLKVPEKKEIKLDIPVNVMLARCPKMIYN